MSATWRYTSVSVPIFLVMLVMSIAVVARRRGIAAWLIDTTVLERRSNRSGPDVRARRGASRRRSTAPWSRSGVDGVPSNGCLARQRPSPPLGRGEAVSSSNVAPDDWDTHRGELRRRRRAQPRPVPAPDRPRLLPTASAGRIAIPIGSGQGDLAVAVAQRWPEADVAGIELSDKGVEIAPAKLPRGRFAQFDLLGGAPPLDGFAAWATHATCSEVLEHVDEPDAPSSPPVAVGARNADRHRTRRADVRLRPARHAIGLPHDRHQAPARWRRSARRSAPRGPASTYRRQHRAVEQPSMTSTTRDASRRPCRDRRVFDGLLDRSPTRGRRGWQLYATAVAPRAAC